MDIIAYKPTLGAIQFPDGFANKLLGKSIDEQMSFFRLSMTDTYSQSSYGDVTDQTILSSTYALDEYYRCTALIVQDDIIVGVMIRDFTGEEMPCLPYHAVTTYYDSDNDGAGYKEREDRVQLICI